MQHVGAKREHALGDPDPLRGAADLQLDQVATSRERISRFVYRKDGSTVAPRLCEVKQVGISILALAEVRVPQPASDATFNHIGIRHMLPKISHERWKQGRKMKYKYPKEFVEKFEKYFKEALKLYLAGKIEYPKYHEFIKGHEAAFAVALAKEHHLAWKG